jgi:XTP/dITP diphosphohydrolase
VTPLYFVSSNRQKRLDVARIFGDSKSPPVAIARDLVEILSHDLRRVVREKAMAAYDAVRLPVMVEHGALYVDHLNGFPGPIVRFFWEKLEDDLPALIPPGATRRAHVVQMVAYCDGRKLEIYRGRIDGRIADQRRGRRGIHWEPTFIPRGHDQTLGEMSPNARIEAHAFTKAYRALRRAHRI